MKFEEQDFSSLRGCVVLLDIDGTIMADGGDCVVEGVKRKIEMLAETNTVYLVSNKRHFKRNNDLAKILQELQANFKRD